MPVYNGNSKAKDLYYGGVKIKEAYYGGTKVYSSGPLYYCYTTTAMGQLIYTYFTKKPVTNGSYTWYHTSNLGQASSSSSLTSSGQYSVTSATDNSFVANTYTNTYYPSGDLYT